MERNDVEERSVCERNTSSRSRGIVPLPIPSEFQTQQVTVHGAQGVLLVDDSLKAGGEIWQTSGIIYMIATTTTSGAEIQDTANSLQ
jgi:hypothetical protein